ncbi:MAG: AAA family ATPase [Phycisphaerales bacterium]|nr:MAG: AAA family ATPase [Phycisphaerales bacterium]
MLIIREITLRNLLSFGPDTPSLPLHSLNVLIGPNGSGKSNLIEALGLLHAAPTHLAKPVREGGGIRDWVWKGTPGATAAIEVVVDNPKSNQSLRHVIEFMELAQKFGLIDERIETVEPDSDKPGDVGSYYRFQRGRPVLKTGRKEHRLQREDVAAGESILSQLKGPDQYGGITYLARVYSRFRLYREWSFGRHTAPRQPQKADQPNEFLEPDGANLGLVLNRLRRELDVKRSLLENLRELYDGIDDYDVSVEGGTVQVFFQESGFIIPATRLSDGTLRYLCLLAILCDPKPPPLVCIEEPELGLHPDILPTIARLLREASTRTQLVVTTHSDILVDQLTETPESVVVCEKSEGQTTMKRLESDKLSRWLEKYRLGELWTKGEIGGARW